MNKIIGETITTALMLGSIALIIQIYWKSVERRRILASMVLTIVAILCMEILLLQV